MKEYCVDLEIAKKLKENGFPQDIDYFYPMTDGINGNKTHYATPYSDEILKELPNEIKGYILEIIRYEDGTIEADYTRNLQYEDDKEYLIDSKKLFYKLSDSLADLWLDLKKEGYIK